MQEVSPPLPGEPVPTLPGLFRRCARAMADEVIARVTTAGYDGITMAAHLVFESLPPDGARLTELADRVGMTHQALGDVVTELERREFVRRVPDPRDRRARRIVLTERGRELVHVALAEIAQVERAWLAHLTEAGVTGDLRAALGAAVASGEPEHRTPGRRDPRP